MPLPPVQQPPPAAVAPAPDLTRRATQLLAILATDRGYADYFAPSFRAAVPDAKLAAIAAQLRQLLGKPVRTESVTAEGAWSAVLRVCYQRGIANMRLALDPAPPHLATGLLITGTEQRDDTLARLTADFARLPGASGFGIYRLTDEGVQAIAALHPDTPAPLGSAFKLWVLAEAARQVAAANRRWSDVVPLGPPSLPSGITQDWPRGTPVTLQTLATLMISISDNTVTDTLLAALGRDRVAAMAAQAGIPGDQAMPSTREFFALKTTANADLLAKWRVADGAGRRALLRDNADRLAATPLDPHMFDGAPVAPDVEWFASPANEARTLDWLRRHGDPTTLAILAINPSADPATRAHFAYVGYKGGSEPGVIAMSYLLRDAAGHWFAVTGNWHRGDATVDALTFQSLMNRALLLTAATAREQ